MECHSPPMPTKSTMGTTMDFVFGEKPSQSIQVGHNIPCAFAQVLVAPNNVSIPNRYYQTYNFLIFC